MKEIFMKNTKTKANSRMLFAIALAVIIGFSMAACGGDPGDDPGPGLDPFNGTWISADVKIIAGNGSWKQYTIPENEEVIRGTYTYSGNTVTAKIKSINTVMFGEADVWVDYANLDNVVKQQIGDTYTFTVTNKSFSIPGQNQTFIVPPNFNGSWAHSASIPDMGVVTITNFINGSDITIKMNGADYQKGNFAFSSKMIYMKVTDEWVDDTWEPVSWDEDVTFNYVLNGNTLTLSNGLVDGEPPANGKGDKLPYFEGAWNRGTIPSADNTAISNAKAAIEGASFTWAYPHDTEQASIKSDVQAIINGLNTYGTTVTIINENFTHSSEGTEENPSGINGAYAFTIVISKGTGTTQNVNMTIIILAPPYTGPIAVEFIGITGEVFTVAINGQLTFGVNIWPEAATDQSISWSVTSGTATHNGNGSFTFTSVGSVTIRATAHNGIYSEITITVKTQSTLATPTIQFNADYGIVSWNTIADAIGYTLLINDTAQQYGHIMAEDRYEYTLPGYGAFTAKVTALGRETESHIYSDSTQAVYEGDYVNPYARPYHATYEGTSELGTLRSFTFHEDGTCTFISNETTRLMTYWVEELEISMVLTSDLSSLPINGTFSPDYETLDLTGTVTMTVTKVH
jgi:hypothetical protein